MVCLIEYKQSEIIMKIIGQGYRLDFKLWLRFDGLWANFFGIK